MKVPSLKLAAKAPQNGCLENTRWWFQTCFILFTPIRGKTFTTWRAYFLKIGWWKTTKQNMTFHDRKIKASTFITLGIEGISISTPTTPVSRTQVLNPQWLADAMAARIEFVFTQKKLLKFNTSPDGKRQWCSYSTHHLIQVCIFKGNVFWKNCEKWYEMMLFS